MRDNATPALALSICIVAPPARAMRARKGSGGLKTAPQLRFKGKV
jgi:hypothetical protein